LHGRAELIHENFVQDLCLSVLLVLVMACRVYNVYDNSLAGAILLELLRHVLSRLVKSNLTYPLPSGFVELQEAPKSCKEVLLLSNQVGLCNMCKVIKEGNPLLVPFDT
jgi:hypothetical protein